jgi:catechol 2,3-dioxygenase-like lactoylglutathione lyase family enzyme
VKARFLRGDGDLMGLTQARVHTTLPASDFARAKDFYEQKLSLTPVSDTPGGAFYETDDGDRFVVFPSAGVASGTHTQLGFRVSDIAAEVAALKDRGVVFEEYDLPGFKTENGIAATGDGRAAFFKDSEGNLLGLVQLPPPTNGE